MEMREKVLDCMHRIFLRYRNVWGNKQSNNKVQLIRVADLFQGVHLSMQLPGKRTVASSTTFWQLFSHWCLHPDTLAVLIY
jgi:hypothetical protein